MKVVIDIPKATYEYYAKLANKGEQINNLEGIILSGTPLPEKHGRLIDAEALYTKMATSSDLRLTEASRFVFTRMIASATTVVPADGVEELFCCGHSDEEIAESFINSVSAVENQLEDKGAESGDQKPPVCFSDRILSKKEVEALEQPKIGKWKCKSMRCYCTDMQGRETWYREYQCDSCGFILNAIEDHVGQYKFCPSCGTRNEVYGDDE